MSHPARLLPLLTLLPLASFAAGVDLTTGHRTWYPHERHEWSVHDSVSHDGKLFARDGGVEPNLHFTRDAKWLIFSGDFHSRLPNGRGVTRAYAVELANSQ